MYRRSHAEVERNLLAKGNVGIWRPKDGLIVDGKLQTIWPPLSVHASPRHDLLLLWEVLSTPRAV